MNESTILNQLDEKIRVTNKEYTNLKKICNRLLISNSAINSLTIGSGVTSITTALTVVGLPVSIVTGVLSGIGGAVSITLSILQKNYSKRLVKKKLEYHKYVHAKNDIMKIMANEDYKLTKEETKKIYDIYNKSLTDEIAIPDTEPFLE